MNKHIVISNYDDMKNPYYGGGGAVAIHNVAKYLAKTHEVTVITGKYPGSKKNIIDGVNYVRAGTFIIGPRVSQLVFQLSLPIKTLTVKHDIWIESFTPPFSTAFTPLFSKKPVIGLVHLLGGEDKARQYKLPFYIIERFGLRFYKNFIVQTKSTESKIMKYNPKANIAMIPNGLEPHYLNRKVNKESSFALFLGRFDINQKGLDILVKAFLKMKKEDRFNVKIAGSGSKKQTKELKSKIKKSGLEDIFELVGRVDGKAKERLLEKAAFMLMPSRYETFPLTAMEAFAFGNAVICFDIDGFKWLPKSLSIKIKPFNIESYSKASIKLMRDSKKRNEIEKSAIKYARAFDWKKITIDYSKYITSVIKDEEK